jgi:hypothetical protein
MSDGQNGETPDHEAGSPGSHCQATQSPPSGSWATQSSAALFLATVRSGRGTRKPGSQRVASSRYTSAVQRATRGSPAGLSTTSPARQAVP